MRDRFAQADAALQAVVRGVDRATGDLVIRRRLEHPFVSVRWKSELPGPQQSTLDYIGP